CHVRVLAASGSASIVRPDAAERHPMREIRSFRRSEWEVVAVDLGRVVAVDAAAWGVVRLAIRPLLLAVHVLPHRGPTLLRVAGIHTDEEADRREGLQHP